MSGEDSIWEEIPPRQHGTFLRYSNDHRCQLRTQDAFSRSPRKVSSFNACSRRYSCPHVLGLLFPRFMVNIHYAPPFKAARCVTEVALDNLKIPISEYHLGSALKSSYDTTQAIWRRPSKNNAATSIAYRRR